MTRRQTGGGTATRRRQSSCTTRVSSATSGSCTPTCKYKRCCGQVVDVSQLSWLQVVCALRQGAHQHCAKAATARVP